MFGTALKQMLAAKDGGKPYDEKALGSRVRSVVAEVVKKQLECGIDVVNDGEIGKSSFSRYVRERLSGFIARPAKPEERPSAIFGRDLAEFPEYFQKRLGTVRGENVWRVFCNGPLQYIGHAGLKAEIENFTAALEGLKVEEAFLPAIAPGTIEHWMKNDYYPSDEAYLFGLAEAMRPEYQGIVEAGFLLQIDDPDLPDGWQINAQVRANTYSIEASNPRHEHEWRVWEEVKLPEGKVLVPGVVGHATDIVEHPQAIADRLVKYAKLVGRENVMAGTDCGLGPRVGHPKIAWAKFEAMAEGARLASKQLWGK
ncbi:MAG: hypothetical protein HYW04_00230 [Deltaproteobacteria bacterium]|nr:hypothetical protein [Deltaproteobacteria bacterium]